MTKISKRMKDVYTLVDKEKKYSIEDAIDVIKKSSKVKFNETVEMVFNLNVDPRKADQMIRGVVTLPHGTGKKVRIMVFANEASEKEALEAGADYAGFKEYYDKIKGGWLDFDVLIVTPDLMREVGKLGKILGPKGLMPSPKSGTVTKDVKNAVLEIKKGKIEYRVDKLGNIAIGIGKVSFDSAQIADNVKVIADAISKAKPATVKGEYMKGVTLSSTMGPGVSLDFKNI